MTALNVIPVDVRSDIRSGSGNAAIGSQIDAFVFDRSPNSLDKDIVTPSTATIHGQLHLIAQDRVDEFLRGELTALIGVDNVRLAKPAIGLLKSVHGMDSLERDRYQGRDAEDCTEVRQGGPTQPAAY